VCDDGVYVMESVSFHTTVESLRPLRRNRIQWYSRSQSGTTGNSCTYFHNIRGSVSRVTR
jgi:hypothetical protein